MDRVQASEAWGRGFESPAARHFTTTLCFMTMFMHRGFFVARDLQPMTDDRISRLLERFARAAVSHNDAIERLDEQAAFRAVASLDRLFAAIAAEGESGREALLSLTGSPLPAVAGMAAVYLLPYYPARCRQVLAELATHPGLIGFRAGAALDRWDRGEWPPPAKGKADAATKK